MPNEIVALSPMRGGGEDGSLKCVKGDGRVVGRHLDAQHRAEEIDIGNRAGHFHIAALALEADGFRAQGQGQRRAFGKARWQIEA